MKKKINKINEIFRQHPDVATVEKRKRYDEVVYDGTQYIFMCKRYLS